MQRISHEIVITQYEDGSHDIRSDHYDTESFQSFASYMLGAGFAEHWIDKLPDSLVRLLKGCGNPHCEDCDPELEEALDSMQEPVIEPSEVFGESNDEDE